MARFQCISCCASTRRESLARLSSAIAGVRPKEIDSTVSDKKVVDTRRVRTPSLS